jgi:hypothetical protein
LAGFPKAFFKINRVLKKTQPSKYKVSTTGRKLLKAPADRTGYDTARQENFKKSFGIDYSGYTVAINLSFTDL